MQDYISSACFKILFAVFGGKSSLDFPGIVTVPFFAGCLNWRWLLIDTANIVVFLQLCK